VQDSELIAGGDDATSSDGFEALFPEAKTLRFAREQAKANLKGAPDLIDQVNATHPYAKTLSVEVLAKLKESGLDASDAEGADIHMSTDEEVITCNLEDRLKGKRHLAFTIPYKGVTYTDTFAKESRQFFRVRVLDSGIDPETGEKLPKYKQPPNSGCHVYYAGPIPLEQFKRDPTVPCALCEGECKALTGAKNGLCVVGLGGTSSYHSRKGAQPDLLNELKAVEWKARLIYVLFDSDRARNHRVDADAHRVGRELFIRQANVRNVNLPDIAGLEKTGLDDFLVHMGTEALHGLLKAAPPFAGHVKIAEVDGRIIHVAKPPSFYDRVESQLLFEQGAQHLFCDSRYLEKVGVDAAGNAKYAERDAWKQWLREYTAKQRARKLVYTPGQSDLLDADGNLNLWPGWNVESVKGDVTPWKELLDHVFHDAPPEDRTYFERWCAYPIKHPGAKLYVGAILWGRVNGAGKTLIGYMLGDVYGPDNYVEINQAQLHGNFNEWSRHRQFILAEEIAGTDKRADANSLKAMLTRDRISINVKHAPEYIIRDTINYLFTSNEPVVTQIANGDRRYFIHRVERALSHEKGAAIRAWSQSPEGGAALRWHLEHLEMGDFDPHAPAPMTQTKIEMIEDSLTSLERYCQERVEAASLMSEPNADTDLWTSEMLIEQTIKYFKALGGEIPKPQAIRMAWKRAGADVLGPVKIHQPTKDKPQIVLRLWYISHGDYWKGLVGAEQHLPEKLRKIDRFKRDKF
jgi:Domain of unknown function (DUF3854)/Family of unknown function (DUF5906)